MKSLTQTSLVGAALLASTASLSSAPLVAFNDNLALFFNGGAGARYESNLFLVDDRIPGFEEEADTILIFSPGLELVYGRSSGSPAYFTAGFREDFKVYLDSDGLDNELENFFLTGRYDATRYNVRANFSYVERDQPDETLIRNDQGFLDTRNDLVERDITDFDSYGEYVFSTKTSLGAGLRYYFTNFETYPYVDSKYWAVPVDFYYAYSPKLDFSVGYRYRDVNSDTSPITGNEPDSTDHFFNVGARGELAPKVSGQVRVGYQVRDYDHRDDDDGLLAFNGAVTWAATPKTAVKVDLRRDFEVGPTEGRSLERTSLGGLVSYAINPMWSAFANGRYTYRDYNVNREDDTYTAGVGANYTPNEYLRVTARYDYLENESTAFGLDFTNHIFAVSASLRY